MTNDTTHERHFLVYIALETLDSHKHLLSSDRLFDVAFNDFTGRGVECDAEWSFAEPGTWSKPRVAVRIPGFGDLDPLQILTDPLDTLRNPLRLLPLPFRFFENREKKDR